MISEKISKYQEILVRDNLIPEYLQDYFELITLGPRTINSGFWDTISYVCKYEPTASEFKNIKPPLSFVHILKNSATLSKNLTNFALIPELVCTACNTNLINIFLARVFIITPQITESKYYISHTDLNIKHFALIYYVNDSDGSTILFDENKNIIKEVEPKKGRILLFNGAILHSGGIPKNSNRCIVNFDIDFVWPTEPE